MNKFNIFIVFDVVANMPLRIFMFENLKVCLRFFENAFKIPNSPLLSNVKDTILVNIGTFDDFLKVSGSSQSFSYFTPDDDDPEHEVLVNCSGFRIKEYDDLVKSLFEVKDERKD